jgi:hypothetical protein
MHNNSLGTFTGSLHCAVIFIGPFALVLANVHSFIPPVTNEAFFKAELLQLWFANIWQ